jgi:hypothetical protein
MHWRASVEQRVRFREPSADGYWIGVAECLEQDSDFAKWLAGAIELESGVNPSAAACGARRVDQPSTPSDHHVRSFAHLEPPQASRSNRNKILLQKQQSHFLFGPQFH